MAPYQRQVDGPVLRGDRVNEERVVGFSYFRMADWLLVEGDEELELPPERPLPPHDSAFERSGPSPTDCLDERLIQEATVIDEHLPGAVAAAIRSMGAKPGQFVNTLAEELGRRGHLLWVVGGLVRDLIAEGPGAPVKDVDATGTARPGELHAMVEAWAMDVRADVSDYKFNFSRGQVWSVRERTNVPAFLEYKTLALDGFRFPVCGGDLRDDAASRDLTVNCLYYDPLRDIVIDPTASGLSDLLADIRRLDSPNLSSDPYQHAIVILRTLKFALRWQHRKLDRTPIQAWMNRIPEDLTDRFTPAEWTGLSHRRRSFRGTATVQEERAAAEALGPAVIRLLDAIDESRTR